MKYAYLILAAANLIAFIQMAIDKRLAVKQRSRISEAQLIAPTLFGGFIGYVAWPQFITRYRKDKPDTEKPSSALRIDNLDHLLLVV